MKKILIMMSLMIFLGGCLPKKRSNYQMKKIVRAFAGHLYIHYHKYSDRERKDNTGKLKGTWPRNPRAHDPHDKPGVKPMRMD
jgi:hypothetical protein